jgi:hypothetical protein
MSTPASTADLSSSLMSASFSIRLLAMNQL